MIKLSRLGWILAFACSLGAFPVAFAVAATGESVWLVKLRPAEDVEFNLEIDMPEKDDPEFDQKIVQIYAIILAPDPEKVVCIPQDKIIHPKEAPHLSLLSHNPEAGDTLLQAQTVFFYSKWILWGAALTGAALMIFNTILAGRRATA